MSILMMSYMHQEVMKGLLLSYWGFLGGRGWAPQLTQNGLTEQEKEINLQFMRFDLPIDTKEKRKWAFLIALEGGRGMVALENWQ